MAAGRSIQLSETSYELLQREACRRGVNPEALADELLRAELAGTQNIDLEVALDDLAEFRAGLADIDGVALAREVRDEIQRRRA